MDEVHVQMHIDGMDELQALLNEIRNDFSAKDANKIITKAIRAAMQPVLDTAKMLAPEDTGALRASLRAEARVPNTKDRRSMYVSASDVFIGTVTTAPGNVLKRMSFVHAKNKTFLTDKKGRQYQIKQVGITSDARANVQEHGSRELGTYNLPAHPYLRPALESQGTTAVNLLGLTLATMLEKYKAKEARKKI